MPARPEDLFARLDALGIATETHDHPPLFTVEDSKRLRGDLPGGHCKNLFLKDKRAELFLAVVLEDRRVDLKWLSKRIGARNLSFAKAELLEEVLGVSPGAVTPFAAINDQAGRVRVVLDRAMLSREPLNYHPLANDRTTAIAPADLVRFLEATGHRPEIVDFDTEGPGGPENADG
ncbi:MAG: prolyl-tRNA synthetase associated domain-containing protein [Rhodospirillaceae bacterium]|jgi:Ala-tRNA(Pro) deacylase|nr:prolyl-tRNA synthetase associated domain-containing protein [Rhodospirillaceae bacterium]MBT6116963.1 prolyl-tRNA synthetase associated domain-containing protein [Rhodospirillaceae bacterium]